VDTISLFFVASIILLGGITAYIADWLGRSLGKKKLSIFGMRPKYTAVLLTTTAGLLIPLITVLLLVSVSREVRVWLAEGQSAVEEKNRKVQELKQMSQKVQLKSQEIAQLEKQNKLETQKLQEAQTKVKELEKKAAQLAQQTTLLRKRVQEYQKAVSEMHQRYAALTKNHRLLQTASENLKSSNNELIKIKNQLSQELQAKEQQSAKLQEEITLLTQRVSEINLQKEEISAQFDLVHKQFHQELEKRRAELEATRLEKDKAQSEIENLQQLKTLLESGLDHNARRTRLTPMIFYQGEELARLPLEAGLSAQEAHQALQQLLQIAHTVAFQRGAGCKPDTKLCAGFELLPIRNTFLKVEDQELAVEQAITGLKHKSLLVAYAFWNTYKGEYVILDIRKFKNPLVYKAGQKIADIVIDGGGSENAISQSLSTLINEKVSTQVQKDGMIPISRHQYKFVEVSYKKFFNLMRRIRHQQAGRPLRVSALARRNTYAGDSLQLDFHINESR
jgi:uncharacterized protein (DUF3084 family)